MMISPEARAARAAAAERAERWLQDALSKPIHIVLSCDRDGYRDVDIAPPWSLNIFDPVDGIDVTLGEDPQTQINTEGGIRIAACNNDFYCNAGSRVTRLYSWELLVASEIADRWKEFWENPQQFVQQLENPNQYRWKVVWKR